MVSGRTFGVLVLAGALAGGCTTAEGTAVSVELYPADGAQHVGVLDGPADTMELVLETAGGPLTETFDLAAGRGALTSVPVGDGFRFTVRGFVGDDSTVQFYGASDRFDVAAGDDLTVPVMVGRADCVGLNRLAGSRDPALAGTSDLQDRRVGASVTPLPDGRVLILGGAEVDAEGRPERLLDTAEVFDPSANQMVRMPWRLVLPRAWHTATVLDDGQVLVVGGVVGVGSPLAVTESAALIDVDALDAVRPLPVGLPVDARSHHQAVAVGDGSVLIAGGETGDGTPLATAVRFIPPARGDMIEGRFIVQGPLHRARTRFGMTRVQRPNDPAVLSGGLGADGPLATVEIFTVNPGQSGCAGEAMNPTSGVGCFVSPGRLNMPEARWGHSAVAVPGGVLVVGGYGSADRSAPVGSVVRVDIEAFASAAVGTLPTPRGEAAAAVVDEGDTEVVLLVGGRVGDTPQTAVTRLSAGEDGMWDATSAAEGCALSEPRFGLSAVGLGTRTLLLVGGVNRSPAGFVGSRRIEIYFPRVNVF